MTMEPLPGDGAPSAPKAPKAARATPPASPPLMKLIGPYAIITTYYSVFGALIAGLLIAWPGAIEFLPVGGAAEFRAAIGGANTLEPVGVSDARDISAVAEGAKLALSIVASFALMLPVTWVCMGARRRKDVSQSFVHTILILPLVITGIVHVVHNSLALAFSLAGIVAGVRFRHTLKDSADTTYLFTSIAVGVSCGINAVEVAAIVSIFFNYAVLGLWATEFGERTTGKTMFAREWMAPKERKARDDDGDDDEDDDDDESGRRRR